MTIRRFEMDIDAFIQEDVEREVLKFQRVISLAALNGVVLKSPVDTGRFRGAWLTSVDVELSDAPTEGGDIGSVTSRAINAGVGVIAGARPFSNIIIQNNVEYGEGLEDGTSKQAPSGMLAVTVAELEGMLR